ncbi:hypothetical protein NDU88_011169 [Pleurodeles waltl]|nr:hypothetical protein NDU88_011169 [Pleurodeles waltl]
MPGKGTRLQAMRPISADIGCLVAEVQHATALRRHPQAHKEGCSRTPPHRPSKRRTGITGTRYKHQGSPTQTRTIRSR